MSLPGLFGLTAGEAACARATTHKEPRHFERDSAPRPTKKDPEPWAREVAAPSSEYAD